MNLFDFLNQLWGVARGTMGGPDFVVIYSAIGGGLFGFLWFKVFITEGLQVATGHRSELPRILAKYLLIALMFLVWPVASNRIFAGVSTLAGMFFPDLNEILSTMGIAMTRMSDTEQADFSVKSLIMAVIRLNPVSLAATTILNGILIIIGMLTLFLCYMLILVNIAGSLAILAMNLVIGPVFFGLAFDRDFRSISVHWFTAVLSYALLMPLYGLALRMAAVIAGAGVPPTAIGFISSGQIAAQLLGPFMAVGIVFSANKVVSALVGGAAGSGLGSSVLGAAAIVTSLIPGGGMIRATAGAASAAARTASGSSNTTVSNSGGMAGSGATSPTARAAKGGN